MRTIMKKVNDQKSPVTFGGLMDEFFQNNLNRFFDDSFWGSSSLNSNRVPVNVKEPPKSYELIIPIPGIKKEEIKVDVKGDAITVSYEHNEVKNSENWLRREYSVQSSSRSFYLDNTVDVNKIVAKHIDGVLQLTLPKKEEAQKLTRAIEIQ
jgi:HSP20 family protein